MQDYGVKRTLGGTLTSGYGHRRTGWTLSIDLRIKRLVLYKPTDRWRYAIYVASGDVVDGYLHLHAEAPADEAQGELVRVASEFAQSR